MLRYEQHGSHQPEAMFVFMHDRHIPQQACAAGVNSTALLRAGSARILALSIRALPGDGTSRTS
jgi:hypothetical protein